KRLKQNLAAQKRQNHAQEQAIKGKLHSLRAQLRQIDGQLKLQTQQAADARELLERIQPLRAKGYVSALQVQQQKVAALDAKTQLKSLKRQRLQIHQQLTSTLQDLVRLPLQLATKNNLIEGKIADITSRLAQNEAQRAMVLRAPRAGVVSTLLAKEGKHVATGQSLLSIRPDGSLLQAQLLVPSRAVGFITPGSRVVLRYKAYPYQKFGQQYGHVTSISRSALGPGAIVALTGKRTKQPLYRVKVELDRQTIPTYGQLHALKPGMALSADIMMERRSLLQWAFEPLYGLKGSVLAGQEHSHG